MAEEEKNCTDFKWYYLFLKNQELREYYDILSGHKPLPIKDDVEAGEQYVHYRNFIYTTYNHRKKVEKYSYTKEEYQQRVEATQRVREVFDGTTDKSLLGDIPTSSILGDGYLFVYAPLSDINALLDLMYPRPYLITDHFTHEVIAIPETQMKEFVFMYEAMPWNVELLAHPIEEYTKQRQLIRFTGGILKGQEGYIMRLHRDMKVVFALGSMTLSINNFHIFPFERIEDRNDIRRPDEHPSI
jgi:hypothetical protein